MNLMDALWLTSTGYDPEKITDLENRFLIGNGYLGVRGALEEYRADRLPAVNLAGIYDRFGDGWREPLNAPNPFYLKAYAGGLPLALPDSTPKAHRQEIDILSGLHRRETVFALEKGDVTLVTERFAHMQDPHRLCMRTTLTATHRTELRLEAGIDSQVWDIHGPHYARLHPEMHIGPEVQSHLDTQSHPDTQSTPAIQTSIVSVTGHTNEGAQVATAWTARSSLPCQEAPFQDSGIHGRQYTFTLAPGQAFTLTVTAAIFTSKDVLHPAPAASPTQAAVQALLTAPSFEALAKSHRAAWRALWDTAFVHIDGDEEAQLALNYSLYHLLCIAPRHSPSLSIAARGLSGQTYKGAVFWDTEMFMLDFYLSVLPEAARSALRYRIDTLPGALEKARAYGLEGAFYAWESQEGGYDACSDYNVTDVFTGRPMRTFFKDKQVHITAAVVYGLLMYTRRTGDWSLLLSGGMRVLLEAGLFYHSLLIQHPGQEIYQLWDVIGPDEYHERVNNNAYTNEMARFVFASAAEWLDELQMAHPADYETLEQEMHQPLSQLKALFLSGSQRIKAPTVQDGVMAQFDGYFALEDASLETVRGRLLHEKEYWGGAYGVAAHTQIIKQADVIALMCMQPERFTPAEIEANYQYYLPRTEHGSSLSACMYALAACRIGRPQEAYPLFLKSAQADLKGGGKEWAGLVYIGGTHPAAAGGAYMVLLRGFLGLHFKDGKPCLSPRLPEGWRRVRLNLFHQGQRYILDTQATL